MCGEKLTTFDAGKLIPGSPPHVRGKVAPRGFMGSGVWITPACAGKSLFHGLHLPFCEDHPRMCGEKKKLGNLTNIQQGSPPHVRGKGFFPFS